MTCNMSQGGKKIAITTLDVSQWSVVFAATVSQQQHGYPVLTSVPDRFARTPPQGMTLSRVLDQVGRSRKLKIADSGLQVPEYSNHL